MRYARLAMLATVLAVVAAIGWFTSPTGDQPGKFVAVVAVMVLLSLPAVAVRMHGGPGWATWLIAFLVPFGFFEIPMGINAWRISQAHVGGDLKGIEIDIMYLAGAVIFIISSLVAVIAATRYPLEPGA
jgi:hypothetical protein